MTPEQKNELQTLVDGLRFDLADITDSIRKLQIKVGEVEDLLKDKEEIPF